MFFQAEDLKVREQNRRDSRTERPKENSDEHVNLRSSKFPAVDNKEKLMLAEKQSVTSSKDSYKHE